jgi:hypothetical protein
MHTQYPKMEEDNEILKVLSAKQNLETPEKSDQIRDLIVLSQLYLDSNLDKVCSQVFYKPCTTI